MVVVYFFNVEAIIFLLIVLIWIAYFVPLVVTKYNQRSVLTQEQAAEAYLAGQIKDENTESLDESENDISEFTEENVSVSLTPSVQLENIKMKARAIARKRLFIFLFLVAATLTCIALSAVKALVWWSSLIPAGALAIFLVVAKLTVERMYEKLDQDMANIKKGWDDPTTLMETAPPLQNSIQNQKHTEKQTEVKTKEPEATGEPEFSLEITETQRDEGNMWGPVSVTVPTYVQQPLAPRSVRTIDLSAPFVEEKHPPVIANADLSNETEVISGKDTGVIKRLPAVGE